MSGDWERIEPGRYALELNGHSLQVIPNPDYEDKRRYVAVVDRKPLGQPQWTLAAAKTRAMQDIHRHRPKADEQILKEIAVFATSPPAVPPPAVPELPPNVALISYKIQGEIRSPDSVKALNQLQAAIRLLEELGVVQNQVFPPGVLNL